LRVKPEIAERTKRFLADVDPEKAIHFEALMTNERASQYLIEVSLGDVNVITANNVEDIYEEVQRRAAEKVAIEKDNEYQGQLAVLQSILRESEKTTERLESSLTETQTEIEARKIEINILSQRSVELQRNYSESLEKISDQERLLISLNAKATEASDAVSKVHNMLEQQWVRGRVVARKHADLRTSQIRWFGVALLFILAFSSGYIDKFVAPHLPAEHQPKANLAIICLQALLAIIGFASLFDPLVRKPLGKLHDRLYASRLAELGIPVVHEPPL